jgi:hypothetical protein
MSISTIFFLATCFAIYKLGAFNAEHPGRAWANVNRWAVQLWTWLNP